MIRDLQKEVGILSTSIGQCQYGLKPFGNDCNFAECAKKQTVVLMNSFEIGAQLNQTCSNLHRHEFLYGRRAAWAAEEVVACIRE